jgi:hypothetical protein
MIIYLFIFYRVVSRHWQPLRDVARCFLSSLAGLIIAKLYRPQVLDC